MASNRHQSRRSRISFESKWDMGEVVNWSKAELKSNFKKLTPIQRESFINKMSAISIEALANQGLQSDDELMQILFAGTWSAESRKKWRQETTLTDLQILDVAYDVMQQNTDSASVKLAKRVQANAKKRIEKSSTIKFSEIEYM